MYLFKYRNIPSDIARGNLGYTAINTIHAVLQCCFDSKNSVVCHKVLLSLSLSQTCMTKEDRIHRKISKTEREKVQERQRKIINSGRARIGEHSVLEISTGAMSSLM